MFRPEIAIVMEPKNDRTVIFCSIWVQNAGPRAWYVWMTTIYMMAIMLQMMIIPGWLLQDGLDECDRV